MGMHSEFATYGAERKNAPWAVSAIMDNPRQVVVSAWDHLIVRTPDRWVYEGDADWGGHGAPLWRAHLAAAQQEHLPVRLVVAFLKNRESVEAGLTDTWRGESFKAEPGWIGRVDTLEGKRYRLIFERAPATSAEYWRVAEAVEALGHPATVEQIEDWLRANAPRYNLASTRADLSMLTVNDTSRHHYMKSRTNFRTDSGNERDRLFRPDGAEVRYVPFHASTHGHWTMEAGPDGRLIPVALPEDLIGLAQAEADSEAHEHLPPVDSDHDARVWELKAVAIRRGQPEFRASLIAAYGSRCAISGCDAVEALEAAHIIPYRGAHTHRLDNGLLLRADLHTLFDLGLIWIDEDGKVDLAESLRGTEYSSLGGVSLRMPAKAGHQPNPAHLAEHAALAKRRRT